MTTDTKTLPNFNFQTSPDENATGLSVSDKLRLLDALEHDARYPAEKGNNHLAERGVGLHGSPTTLKEIGLHHVHAVPYVHKRSGTFASFDRTDGPRTYHDGPPYTTSLGVETYLSREEMETKQPGGFRGRARNNADRVSYSAYNIAQFLGEVVENAGLTPLPENREDGHHSPKRSREGIVDVPEGQYAWFNNWKDAGGPGYNDGIAHSNATACINSKDTDKVLEAIDALRREYREFEHARPPQAIKHAQDRSAARKVVQQRD